MQTKQMSVLAAAVMATSSLVSAATLYWDTNGSAAGTGTNSSGTWNTSTSNVIWSTDSTGASATTSYVSGSGAVFAAGIDAGAISVALGSNPSANSLFFEEGVTTLTKGSNSRIDLGAGGLALSTGTAASFDGELRLTATAVTPLTLAGSSQFSTATFNRTAGIAFFRGDNLGTTGAKFIVTGTSPTLTGSGAAGTSSVGVISHAFGDASAGGTGSGFVTYDAANGVRLLTASETVSTMTTGQNVALSSGSVSTGSVTVNSLALSGNAAITGTGTVSITSLDLLVMSGATASIQQSVGGSGLLVNAIGDISIGGNIAATGGSAAKYGAGTLTLGGYVDGSFTVNGGTVQYNNTGGFAKIKGLTINGGIFRYGNNGAVIDGNHVNVNAGGTLDLNGWSDTINNLNGGGTITGGTGSVGVLTVNGSGTFSGNLEGNLQLVKGGTTTLTLSGTNTYGGGTVINSGKIIVTGSISGDVTVNGTGTIGGAGSLGGLSMTGGVLAPGSSAGTLTAASLSLNADSSLLYELSLTDHTVGNAINDYIVVNGNLVLDGTLNLAVLSELTVGTYKLIGYTGSLANNGLLIGSNFGNAGGQVYSIDTSTAGAVNLVVAIPEPATFALTGFAIASLLATRRRRLA